MPNKFVHKSLVILIGLTLCCATFVALPVFFERPTGILDGNVGNPDDFAKALMVLSPEEIQQKIERQRKQLLQAPLDSAVLSNLSILYSLSGEKAKSDELAKAASELSLRSGYGQYFAVQSNMSIKDYDAAYYHMDAALTSNPQFVSSFLPIALSFGDDAKAYDALAKVLDRNPSWRREFFNWLVEHDPAGEITFNIFDHITASGGKIDDQELREYLRTQITQNHIERAYYVWLNSLMPSELSKVAYIFDGSFETTSRNLFFDWTISPFQNSSIGFLPRNGEPANVALRLSFYNSTAKFQNVSQLLRLPPGQLTFSGASSAREFKSLGGLAWVITCYESGNVLGRSQAFTQSMSLQQFGFEFAVPQEGCDSQMLRLESASVAELDAAMSGEIEFEHLSISANAAANGG